MYKTIPNSSAINSPPSNGAHHWAGHMPTAAKSAGLSSQAAIAQQTAKLKKPIKLLLVDDHPVVRRGIASCLSRHSNLMIVGEASDGQEALRQAALLTPDIILMDIEMPNMSGLAVTEILRKDLPRIKVLILSMHRHTEYILRILRSGARGYVLKDSSPDELIKAIEMVDAGESF